MSSPHSATGGHEDEPQWLDDQEQSAWRAYLRASRELWAILDRDLAVHQLSLAEYETLSMLSEADNMRLRMSALADLVVQSRSRLTHTAKRLEQRGFVKRVPVTDDRRGVELVLLTPGLEILEAASRLHVQGVRAYLIDVLDHDEFLAIGEASAKVTRALETQSARPAATYRGEYWPRPV